MNTDDDHELRREPDLPPHLVSQYWRNQVTMTDTLAVQTNAWLAPHCYEHLELHLQNLTALTGTNGHTRGSIDAAQLQLLMMSPLHAPDADVLLGLNSSDYRRAGDAPRPKPHPPGRAFHHCGSLLRWWQECPACGHWSWETPNADSSAALLYHLPPVGRCAFRLYKNLTTLRTQAWEHDCWTLARYWDRHHTWRNRQQRDGYERACFVLHDDLWVYLLVHAPRMLTRALTDWSCGPTHLRTQWGF